MDDNSGRRIKNSLEYHDVYLQNKLTMKEIMRQVIEIIEKVFGIEKITSRFPN
jgi:hypothetical protein